MARAEVLLTVRRFDVLVTYHPFDGLTPVEEHLLLAVSAGLRTIDRLAGHLGLPRRMIVDACVDLLSIGALEVAETGELGLSERTREAVGDWKTPKSGWTTAFATKATPTPEFVSLMQETVTGCVFRALPRQPEYRPGLPRLPQDPELLSIDEIPRSEILAAVLARPLQTKAPQDELPSTSRARRARIGDVRLRRAESVSGGPQPAAEVTAHQLAVELRSVRPVEDLPPRFAILGPDNVPSIVRVRIAAGLARLWELGVGRGPDQVFERLSYADSPHDVDAVRTELPDAPLQRLERALVDAGNAPTSEHHAQLLAVERDAVAAIARAVAGGVGADLVEGARAHHDALEEALANAKHQVILAGPWVARLENPALRDAIERATRRGVNVILLWGIGPEEVIPPAVASLRDELAASARAGSFRVAARSARNHAKVMVCDHDWAIVTSCNFLNSSPERTTPELGVRLTSPPRYVDVDPADERTAPSHPITDLLRWTRAVAPDYRVGRFIGDSPVLFGLSSGGRRLHDPAEILPPVAAMPRLWQEAWRKRIDDLRRLLDQTGTYAFAIDSGAHREVLFDAIGSAQRRVLIESPDVTTVATAKPFIDSLLDARRRGVDVVIRFAKRQPAGPDGDARWDELAPAGVRLRQEDTHAKLLVVDDWILVSSFNFLSFEGRHRRELGVQVIDPPLAERVSARFG